VNKYFFALFLIICNYVVSENLYFNADNYQTNLKDKSVSAKGNVKLKYKNQLVKADLINFQAKDKAIQAQGDLNLTTIDYSIDSEKMDWDFKSETGTLWKAYLDFKNGIKIQGTEITKKDKNIFLIKDGEFTTCKNCTKSWSIASSMINIDQNKTARFEHVFFKIRGTPVFYLPFFIYPIGVKRHSGFFIPTFSYDKTLGTSFANSFFWNINQAFDMTFRHTYQSKAGNKFNYETRYKFSNNSYFYNLLSTNNNKNIQNVENNRWGMVNKIYLQLLPSSVLRSNLNFTSDPYYSLHFEEDFNYNRFGYLLSNLSLNYQSKFFDLNYSMLWSQDNIIRDKAISNLQLPKGNIHILPKINLNIYPIKLFNNLFFENSIDFRNFTREDNGLDSFNPWIRTGKRLNAKSSLRYSFNLNRYLYSTSVVSARFNNYFFSTPGINKQAQSLTHAFKTSISNNMWKTKSIYNSQKKIAKKYHISLKPQLSYNYGPNFKTTNHLFFNQSFAPQFDLFDPFSNESLNIRTENFLLETNLQKHQYISTGFKYSYDKVLDNTINTPFNFNLNLLRNIDLNNSSFDRYYSNLTLKINRWNLSKDFSFSPDFEEIEMKSFLGYKSDNFLANAGFSIGNLIRNSTLTVDYNINKYLKFRSAFSYNHLAKNLNNQLYGFSYYSPSNCWALATDFIKTTEKGARITPVLKFIYKEPLTKTKKVIESESQNFSN